MQEVEGEEFLRGLWQLLSSKEPQLPQLALVLTTLQAQFINNKLTDVSKGALRSQRLAHLAKKKPLDHNELLDLQFYLEQVGQLRLSSAQETLDETTLVDLSGFRGLSQLHIVRCKPSILYNFVSLSPHLRHLTIDRSISSVSEILKAKEGEEEKPWSQLKVLNAAHNYISSIDDSLVGLSGLERLNLSHNLIQRVENLQFCYSLVHVDLGHNRIRSVQNTVETLGNLRVLILCDNGLESTSGLEKLLGLERLDISDNQLMQPADLQRLGLLPNLGALEIRGNPMTSIAKYRTQIFEFVLKDDLQLDGTLPSQSERAAMEAKRAEIPLVPYAGHTTISKVGAIETAKPAFQSSGRALPSESLDPSMVYNYPQLRADDRRVQAEVAVTVPPLPYARPKHISTAPPGSGNMSNLSSSPSTAQTSLGATSGSGSSSSSSSSIGVYAKKKPNQKHPKRKVVAEILDPAASPVTERSLPAKSSNGSSFSSAMVPSGPTGTSGQPEDLPQILQWAEEERWLLNYNAYRKRLDDQEAANAAAAAASLSTSGGVSDHLGTSPGSGQQLTTSGDRLGVSPNERPSTSPIPLGSPVDDGPNVAGSLGSSTDLIIGTSAPGSGTTSRRRLPEVSRKTFMMPSSFTADMLSELDANSSDADFQKFAESTVLAISKGSRKPRPVTTMVSPSSGSAKLELSGTSPATATDTKPRSNIPAATTSNPTQPPQSAQSQSSENHASEPSAATDSHHLMQFGSPDDLRTTSPLDAPATAATAAPAKGSMKVTVTAEPARRSLRHASSNNAILSESEELALADHGNVDPTARLSGKSDEEQRSSMPRDSLSPSSPAGLSPSPSFQDVGGSSPEITSTAGVPSSPSPNTTTTTTTTNPTTVSPQKGEETRRPRPRSSKYTFNLPGLQEQPSSSTSSSSTPTPLDQPITSFAAAATASSSGATNSATSSSSTSTTTGTAPSSTKMAPTSSKIATTAASSSSSPSPSSTTSATIPAPTSTKIAVTASAAAAAAAAAATATQSASPSASDLLDAMLEDDFTQLLTTPTTINKDGVLEVDTSSVPVVGPSSTAAAPKSTKITLGGISSGASSSSSTQASSTQTATSEAISSEEFLVSTPGAMGSDEWEDRIVIVNTKFLEEWDTQGSVVLRLESKELVDASLTYPGPVVVLSYGNTNPRAFSPHTTCTYRMESESDANNLLKVMKGILTNSTKKLKCVTCQSIFTMQKMLECQKCNGNMLIHFESSSGGPSSSSSWSAAAPSSGGNGTVAPPNSLASASSSSAFNSSSALPHYEDVMDATLIPMNRKIYTRTMHLQDAMTGEMEEMIAYFPCWFVPFGASIQKEQRASIVLSDTKLMIFTKRRPRKGSVLAFGKTGKEGVPSSSEEDFKDEELLVSMPLRALKRVIIGPFWQWIRIENATNPSEPFVMTTRSHARTFRFLQLFKSRCGWVEMTNKNKEFSQHVLDAIKLQLKDAKASTAALVPELEGIEIDLYFLAYQRIKAGFNLLSAVRSTVVYGKDTTLVSRAVILTKHNILICEEDYGKWPSLTLSSWNPPKTPHFTILQHFSYHDIVSLSIAHPNEHHNYVGLTFEFNTANGSTSQQQIILITQGDGEKQKLISLVSQRYQEHFHIKLVPEQQ